jgi:hypothetical protein
LSIPRTYTFFRMTVLNPSPNPSTLLAPSNKQNQNVLSLLAPALTHSYYLAILFQRILSTTTIFLFFRAYILSTILLRQSFYASQILFMQSYYASAVLAKQLCWTSKVALHISRKESEKLRNKLIFEFMVFVLGSGGNSLLLIVFWPGWIVVGGGVYGIYWIVG